MINGRAIIFYSIFHDMLQVSTGSVMEEFYL
jgi:hypothetical protein